mgnify:CR=1 FL=1
MDPLLFLLYINDLCDCLTYLTPLLYADDTNLFLSSKNLNESNNKLNSDLKKLSYWCHNNKLTINTEKTYYTIFKTYQNKSTFDLNITLNNIPIKAVEEVKFLGVSIDKNLSWSSHTRKLLLDFRPISGILYRLSEYVPKKVLVMLYYSFIHSKLCYLIKTWGNAPQIHLKKLIQFQKTIVRIINLKPFGFPTKNLFVNSDKLYKYKILIQAHQLFHSNSSLSMSHYDTRHQLLSLPVPKYLTSAGQRSSNFTTPALWNKLPNALKQIKSLGKFKVGLRLYLHSVE